MKYRILITDSLVLPGQACSIHQIVVEFDSRLEAETAISNLKGAKSVHRLYGAQRVE